MKEEEEGKEKGEIGRKRDFTKENTDVHWLILCVLGGRGQPQLS